MDFLDIIWIVVCIVLVAVPDLVFNNKKKKSARGRTRTSGPMPQMSENFPMPPMPSVPSEPESMPTEDEPEDFPRVDRAGRDGGTGCAAGTGRRAAEAGGRTVQAGSGAAETGGGKGSDQKTGVSRTSD